MDLSSFRMKAYSSGSGKASSLDSDEGTSLTISKGAKDKAHDKTHGKALVPHKGNSLVKTPVSEVVNAPRSEVVKANDSEKAITTQKDNLYRRVAKFLVLIGTDEAAKILPHLTAEQTERIIPEIATIRHIDEDEATAIFAEFEALLQKSKEDGGVETARTILEKAFGKDKAEAMIEKTVAFPDGKPFQYFSEVGPDRIMTLLNDESASTKALVLSQLEPSKAASVINAMPPEAKKDVILRLAKMQKVMPEVLKQVDIAMQEKLKRLNVGDSENIDGRSALASILRAMNLESEEDLLIGISRDNPDLGQELRNRLFTAEDVIAGDDKFIQHILHTMEDMQIVHLIAGKGAAFRDKMLNNVSSNRKKAILETEDIEKPFRKSDCERETSIFFSKLRHAYEDGQFVVKGRNEGEYVE